MDTSGAYPADLSRSECLKLMSTARAGRVVYTRRALPVVELTGFTVDRGDIVIRTSPGSTLAAAARDAVVAFETDCPGMAGGAGWSVTAIGHARLVTDPAGSALEITPEIVTGRVVYLEGSHVPQPRSVAGWPGHGLPCTR